MNTIDKQSNEKLVEEFRNVLRAIYNDPKPNPIVYIELLDRSINIQDAIIQRMNGETMEEPVPTIRFPMSKRATIIP